MTSLSYASRVIDTERERDRERERERDRQTEIQKYSKKE